MSQVFYHKFIAVYLVLVTMSMKQRRAEGSNVLMLQIHCCNGKVNMINLNTKGKHGETSYHCAFKEGQFEVIP